MKEIRFEDSSYTNIFQQQKSDAEEYVRDEYLGPRESDIGQERDLDLILSERASRFYDPKLVGVVKERCILVAVDVKSDVKRQESIRQKGSPTSLSFVGKAFSLKESLSELSELVGTAGLEVMGSCIQRVSWAPNTKTYRGPGILGLSS